MTHEKERDPERVPGRLIVYEKGDRLYPHLRHLLGTCGGIDAGFLLRTRSSKNIPGLLSRYPWSFLCIEIPKDDFRNIGGLMYRLRDSYPKMRFLAFLPDNPRLDDTEAEDFDFAVLELGAVFPCGNLRSLDHWLPGIRKHFDSIPISPRKPRVQEIRDQLPWNDF